MPAVEFNDETLGRTEEIHDVGTDRHLPPEMRAVYREFFHRRVLEGLSYDNKKTSLPLAAADLFAYTAWGQEVGQKPIGTPMKAVKSDGSCRGNYFQPR